MEIVPFSSIGELSFGDHWRTAREKLSSNVSPFVKDVGERNTDAFDELGVHLYFDEQGLLEFVEAFPPANITYKGIKFLLCDLQSVIERMQAMGLKHVESDVGVRFPGVGISLTAPNAIVEGIAAYRKGYYD